MMSIYVMHIYKVAKIYSTNKGMPKGTWQRHTCTHSSRARVWSTRAWLACALPAPLSVLWRLGAPWTIDLCLLLLCIAFHCTDCVEPQNQDAPTTGSIHSSCLSRAPLCVVTSLVPKKLSTVFVTSNLRRYA